MGFWTLFEVASMPVFEVLIVSLLGAFMATNYSNLLHADARSSLNKIVFIVFTPSLMFSNLAKTVTLQDIISWWFMPVNVGLIFLLGGFLGWMLVKILKPKPFLEGVIIATCSAGNLGNLPLIIVPAICNEKGSPFGDRETCRSIGISYASFSMALGGIYIWTYTYHLMRTSARKLEALGENGDVKERNNDLDANAQTHLLSREHEEHFSITFQATKSIEIAENQTSATTEAEHEMSLMKRLIRSLHKLKELLAPSTLAAIIGFTFGATKWLRNLLLGDTAPLRVIHDSLTLLGGATIPCITLILGGNLTQGLRSSRIKPVIIVGVILVRYLILPAIGIGIIKLAGNLGLLAADPLFRYVLMIQYNLPPAMNIGTMAQLFNVGQEECSVIFLWTYLVASLALTLWSTFYLWILF